MEYEYKDAKVRKLFEAELQQKIGVKAAKSWERRLGEIIGAENLAELLTPGPGKWHVLDGRDGGARAGQIACSLTGNYRAIMAPPDGPYGKCTLLIVTEYVDYH